MNRVHHSSRADIYIMPLARDALCMTFHLSARYVQPFRGKDVTFVGLGVVKLFFPVPLHIPV